MNETITKGRSKSATKRQQIHEAAVALFLDKGFDNTSMDEVADQAGVSKQTVYSHFKSKEELFSACVKEKCASYQLTESFFEADRNVEEMLTEIALRFSDMLLSYEAVRVKRILCASCEQQPELSELFYHAGPQNMLDLMTDYLTQLAEDGALNIDNPSFAARQFLYMVQGEKHMRTLLNVAGGPSEREHNDYVRDCVRTFMRAFGPDRTKP